MLLYVRASTSRFFGRYRSALSASTKRLHLAFEAITFGSTMSFSAHDVAAYILEKKGLMTTMKLQKLVYYSQAWSLVWDERPLFNEEIQAWANGPVVRELYDAHRGQFQVSTWERGNVSALDEKAKETVDAVLKFYGDKTGQWLSDLSHMEAPWKDARTGLAPTDRSEAEISPAAMSEYYGSLQR